MKNYLLIAIGFLFLFISSCSSDEPETPYTGPWEIFYEESYVGLHNNSPEFVEWFNNHTDDFEIAFFRSYNVDATYSDYVELDDYKHFQMGDICWHEIVQKATEEEIKAKVKEFESFTIIEDYNTKSDLFQAKYQRYEDK